MNSDSKKGLSTAAIVSLLVLALALILLVTLGAQYYVDYVDRHIVVASDKLNDKKTEYEITKLDAEISSIRSDTAGSLFWLKLIALFVTVGGAVGGYLIGQSRTTIARLNFEDRKNVDEVYQSIVQELASDSPILRAASAVKLGAILKSFPAEWNVSDNRKAQLLQLTKQVLAAALSIEDIPKVLKTLTISIVLHKPESSNGLANVQELDLSGANAEDAYWARCDFENADFYRANLCNASFRKSKLSGAQFRESNLNNAIFIDSKCINTNFKMADLRGASFDRAYLKAVNFENAKVHSISLKEATIDNIPDCLVDVSVDGNGSQLIVVGEWLESAQR
ncbi:MAG: pentapeptide repeat-containing protein [Methylobacter sp.]